MLATLLLMLILTYAIAGSLTAMAFAAGAAGRLLHGAEVSPGARLLLMPGAFMLWPLIVKRWAQPARQCHDA
jgi:hypothetical protein